MKAINSLAALALMSFWLGTCIAVSPYFDLHKSVVWAGNMKPVDLRGTGTDVFAEIRGSPGALSLHKELPSMADDWLPISRNDYYWQTQSPIYYNPNMDYYWGFQTYDLEGDYGGEWRTHIPTGYDEWHGDTSLSWDKDQIALNNWANANVPPLAISGE